MLKSESKLTSSLMSILQNWTSGELSYNLYAKQTYQLAIKKLPLNLRLEHTLKLFFSVTLDQKSIWRIGQVFFNLLPMWQQFGFECQCQKLWATILKGAFFGGKQRNQTEQLIFKMGIAQY